VADAGMALAQSATTNKIEKLFFISLLKRFASRRTVRASSQPLAKDLRR
jgi:hypothetical protein